MNWLQSTPQFLAALCQWALEPVELHLTVSWPGGSAETIHSGPGPFPFVVDDRTQGELRWGSDFGSLQIAVAGQPPQSVALPGKFSSNGGKRCFTAMAKLAAATNQQEAPPRLHHDSKGPLSLADRREGQIGRDGRHWLVLDELELTHAVFARGTDSEYWLCDLPTAGGTFVNGEPIVAQQLTVGDLIQIGSSAWQFGEGGFFCPTQPVAGVSVRLEGVQLAERLGPINIDFKAGELTAIVGPSGIGKSTLISLIVGTETPTAGKILVGDVDAVANRSIARQLLGHVPQGHALHPDLTATQVAEHVAAIGGGSTEHVEEILRTVGLHDNNQPFGNLSGGEKRRAQLAGQLVLGRGVVLLDEPTTGLDPLKEHQILQLLRVLSRRGAAVIVVTHTERRELFDRVIELERMIGQPTTVKSDNRKRPSGMLLNQTKQIAAAFGEAVQPEAVPATRGANTNQIGPLLLRELRLIYADPARRLIVPGFITPTFFALVLGFSLKMPNDLDRLGFLAVVSCIWMSGSVGLLAIVEERSIIDCERRMYLEVVPYLAAKLIALGGVVMLQLAVFVGVLLGLISRLDLALAVIASLGFVSVAGLMLGLFLSAISGSREAVANYLLPLAMIAQLVFSLSSAGGSSADVARHYEKFSLGSLSECDTRIVPMAGSYLTISRWGDQALRSVLAPVERGTNWSFVARGYAGLVTLGLLFCLATYGVLVATGQRANWWEAIEWTRNV